jgi:hypothetical protein
MLSLEQASEQSGTIKLISSSPDLKSGVLEIISDEAIVRPAVK